MNHAEMRAALLRLAADEPNVSSATLKRALDLLTFFDIEELDVASVALDDWGGVSFTFAAAELPVLAVRGYDVTACADDPGHPVAKLVNAVTCALDAEDADDAAGDALDEDAEDEG